MLQAFLSHTALTINLLSHEIYFNDWDDGDIKCHLSIVRKAHKDLYRSGIREKLCLHSTVTVASFVSDRSDQFFHLPRENTSSTNTSHLHYKDSIYEITLKMKIKFIENSKAPQSQLKHIQKYSNQIDYHQI